MDRKPLRSLTLAAVAAISLALPSLEGAADEVLVFAAASLTNALDQVAEAWTAETGHRAVMSYAASSAIARRACRRSPSCPARSPTSVSVRAPAR